MTINLYTARGEERHPLKVSREQVEENGRRILDAASRLFRDRGIQGVTVADVMQAAGLTHGAFYGYFKSKDELVAQTLTHVLAEQGAEIDLPGYASSYLSLAHCQDRAGGCVLAGLGAEAVRASPEARAAMTEGLRRQIDRMARALPGTRASERRQAARSICVSSPRSPFSRISRGFALQAADRDGL